MKEQLFLRRGTFLILNKLSRRNFNRHLRYAWELMGEARNTDFSEFSIFFNFDLLVILLIFRLVT